jgi:Tfp pilus assembly protein PilF
MKKDNPDSPKLSFRKKTILIILGIFLFFILLEIGLRLGGVIFLTLQERRNIASIKQRGTYRIMCLGESTTALGGKDSYPSQLEQILNQRNIGIKFSVINEGLIAFDTTGILSQLEYNLNKYRPDMVIAMMGINDEGERVAHEDSFIFKSFRTYKLAKLLWLHIVTKAKEKTIYKPTKPSNIGLKDNLKQTTYIQSEDELKNAIELNPSNDWAYEELARIYIYQGKFAQAEELFKKAIELNPGNDWAYMGLGRVYIAQVKSTQAEEEFKKAIELNPRNDRAYLELGSIYIYQGKSSQGMEKLKKAIELNPGTVRAYEELARIYTYQGKFAQAEELFKKAIELSPGSDRPYAGLIVLYQEMGKITPFKEYERIINGLRLHYYIFKTSKNYLRLKEILDGRAIKLVCAQYPVRSVEPLKKIFEGQDGVIFVDNEKIFKEAIKKEGYKEYFTDMIGGDFGHCTPKGNRLLAENIANIILKEYFNK